MMRMNERSQIVKTSRPLWCVQNIKVLAVYSKNLRGQVSTVILIKSNKTVCRIIYCKLHDNHLECSYHKLMSYMWKYHNMFTDQTVLAVRGPIIWSKAGNRTLQLTDWGFTCSVWLTHLAVGIEEVRRHTLLFWLQVGFNELPHMALISWHSLQKLTTTNYSDRVIRKNRRKL